MCGIAGFLGPWKESLAIAMASAEAHRGPDGSDTWVDPDYPAVLSHVRLSIIDLSDDASQPMKTSDGRFIIVFNGEIYNYLSLKEELTASGEVFRTKSDTEVLLKLFAREGADCLSRLRGIFAFAVWDAKKCELFLARDHIGVKPLYYSQLKNGFLFASELKALTLCPELPRDINPVAVSDHLSFIWTGGTDTMLKSVKKMRPGTTLTVSATAVKRARYYQAPLHGSQVNLSLNALDLRDLLDEVVSEQMIADVEVGVLLSGGLDSSAVLSSMVRGSDPINITAFCAYESGGGSSADNFGNDRKYALEVAKSMGINIVEVPTETDIIGKLPDMVWSLDEPTADFAGLQTLALASAAKDNGIKVLLSGVGGDDLFTGYGRHTAALLYAIFGRIDFGYRFCKLISKISPRSSVIGRRVARLVTLLSRPESQMLAESMGWSDITEWEKKELFSKSFRKSFRRDSLPEAFLRSLDATNGLHPVERLLDLEINGFLPDHNLNYTDKMAMQAGVEIRVPLCDPRIVSFSSRLPLSQLINLRTTKRIFRNSQRGQIPSSIIRRSKQGLGVPVRSWLSGPARPMLEELTSSTVIKNRGFFDEVAVKNLRDNFLSGANDAAMVLFPMMAIELWCRGLKEAPIHSD